jgi:SPX domain protein involved in polyphosphate accumulation
MNSSSTRDYRYERKFLVENLETGQVRLIIRRHPSMFHEPYPPRRVNNLYLDTRDLDNYLANINGAAYRSKVRIRWYGQIFDHIPKPVLEFKIKNGLVGTKHSFPFPAFALETGFSRKDIQHLISQSELPGETRNLLRGLEVVLCNSYKRSYFASKDKCFRLTVDNDMVYYRVNPFNNKFRDFARDDNHVIVELKYDKPYETSAERVSKYLPFRITRSSKYVTGMESIYP